MNPKRAHHLRMLAEYALRFQAGEGVFEIEAGIACEGTPALYVRANSAMSQLRSGGLKLLLSWSRSLRPALARRPRRRGPDRCGRARGINALPAREALTAGGRPGSCPAVRVPTVCGLLE